MTNRDYDTVWQAGIQASSPRKRGTSCHVDIWIPAFAGMTEKCGCAKLAKEFVKI